MSQEPELQTVEWTGPLVAELVRAFREQLGWTQETLAEIAGVSTRTVQRVERGRPSGADTRRALARAFEIPNIDVWVDPLLVPSEEWVKREKARLDKETVTLKLSPVSGGRQLRQLAETAHAMHFDESDNPPEEVGEALATLLDYVSDYGDIHDVFSHAQKREVDADLGRMLREMQDSGWSLSFNSRPARFGSRFGHPFELEILYLVAAPNKGRPEFARVPRSVSLT